MKNIKSSLAKTHPEVAAQWHPTKNGDLTPNDVTMGSNKKFWWKCPVADDHEWDAAVNARTSAGHGCSCCAGRTVVPSNCLATTHPDIAAQWHPTKNGDLTPRDVTMGSGKKVWWKCPVADDHEWEAKVSDRTTGNGCSCCRGLMVVSSNCLAKTHPEVAAQWHPTKNGNLTPKDVTAGSNQKVWWKCPVADDHEWEKMVAKRALGYGCPCCRGNTVVQSKCLAKTHPEVAAQWHPTKNGDLTPNDVTAGHHKKVWWKCPVADDHEWDTLIYHRTHNESGCACCAGKKAVSSNCLTKTHPEIASQWHPTKNGDLTPNDVTAGGNQKVWWKCPVADEHEWKTSVNHRTGGCGCPNCIVSKGEDEVREIIKKLGIIYINKNEIESSLGRTFTEQYVFVDLNYKKALRCDFAIFHDGKVLGVIEFQGHHHYMPVRFNGTSKEKADSQFVKQQIKDQIKRDYFSKHNIALLEIHYNSRKAKGEFIDDVTKFIASLGVCLHL